MKPKKKKAPAKKPISLSSKRLGNLLDHIENEKDKVEYILEAIRVYNEMVVNREREQENEMHGESPNPAIHL